MKTMTVRGLDPESADKLHRIAKQHGKSVNQLVLDIIQESLGTKKALKYTATFDDMDQLFGKWSKETFDRIQKKIDNERLLDKELWQ